MSVKTPSVILILTLVLLAVVEFHFVNITKAENQIPDQHLFFSVISPQNQTTYDPNTLVYVKVALTLDSTNFVPEYVNFTYSLDGGSHETLLNDSNANYPSNITSINLYPSKPLPTLSVGEHILTVYGEGIYLWYGFAIGPKGNSTVYFTVGTTKQTPSPSPSPSPNPTPSPTPSSTSVSAPSPSSLPFASSSPSPLPSSTLPPSTMPQQNSNGSSLPTWIYWIVAAVAVVAVISIVAVFLKKKADRKRSQATS